MVKTKTDVQRILDKIEGEKETAYEFKSGDEINQNEDYFEGKEKALEDLKTWIQENILEEE